MDNYLEKSFEVYSYHVDFHKKAKIRALFGFFQEAASLHATQLNVGFEQLSKKHQVFWALSRLSLKMNKYPLWQENIKCRTWPKGVNRVFAQRDFEFLSENNEVLASGASDWAIISLENRSLQNPIPIVEGVPFLANKHGLKQGTKKIRPITNSKQYIHQLAKYGDLDMNKHVNSIRYLDWVLDILPFDFLIQHDVEELHINFQHEVSAPGTIEIHWFEFPETQASYVFTGMDSKSKTPFFNIEIKFKPNGH